MNLETIIILLILLWPITGLIATFVLGRLEKWEHDPSLYGILFALSLLAGPLCFFAVWSKIRNLRKVKS